MGAGVALSRVVSRGWLPGVTDLGPWARIGLDRLGDLFAAVRAPWWLAGGYAERITVPAAAVFAKPPALDHPAAANLLLAGTTAAEMLHVTGVRAGDTVVVHGASGAVGVSVLQQARELGARCVGTASEHNFDTVRRFGGEPVVYGDGLADRIWFNAAVNAGAWYTSPSFVNLTTPIASGQATTWFSNGGNTVNIELKDPITLATQTYSASGILASPPTGTRVGIGYFGNGNVDDFRAWTGSPTTPTFTVNPLRVGASATMLMTDTFPAAFVAIGYSTTPRWPRSGWHAAAWDFRLARWFALCW